MVKCKAVFFILLVAFLLTSCSSSVATPQASLTRAIDTAISAAWTDVADTEMPVPTNTPNATQLASVPGTSLTVIPPQADEQVYVDPEGWYAVNFPAYLKPASKSNSFAGEQRIIETGYLPYASNAMNLCLWIANLVLRPEQSSVEWQERPCSVLGTDGTYRLRYAIYENPLADLEHRFIYVKMGEAGTVPAPYIPHTVSWLKPASQTHSASTPLSSEESSFWENPNTLLKVASLTEYVLPREAQVGPINEMLLRYAPEEAQPDWAALRNNASTSQAEPSKEEQLKFLGYELKVLETQPNFRQQLFRDGRILFDDVKGISKIYAVPSDSGPIHAFIVDTVDMRQDDYVYFNSFLIVNDAINAWQYSSQDPGFAPILYQGELLWAIGTQDSHVEVKKSNGEVLFNFETYFSTHLEVDSLRAWNGHWILTAGDFLIQDGEILNQTLGFQEIFEWSIVDDKPVYLFRRGSRLGLSYDGKFLLLPYEDIPRGLCCGFASNNPMTIDHTIYFFGKRDGTWYYAVVKL